VNVRIAEYGTTVFSLYYYLKTFFSLSIGYKKYLQNPKRMGL